MADTNSNNPGSLGDEEARPSPAAPIKTFALVDRTDAERDVRSYQRWLVVLVTITIAAACLLVSAGHGAKQGTRPWSANSGLRVIVELLNFNYAYPTPRGNDVKWLAQGLGAAAAIVTAGLVWYVRTGRRRDGGLLGGESEGESKRETPARKPFLEQITLVGASQIALVAYGAWAIYSYRWAHWPAAAMGEGVRNLIVIIWAVCLGRTMTRWSALRAGMGLSLALMLTAIIGLWYHFERNPVLRLEFPIGNPIFFAACMLSALMLAVAGLGAVVEVLSPRQAASTAQRKSVGLSPVWVAIGALLVLAVVGWAFVLTHSRGPQVALLAGLSAGAGGFILRVIPQHRRRLVGLGFVAIVLAGGFFAGRPYLEAQQSVTAGGRGASFRLRSYTWKYAADLFLSQPLMGHGQGSYLCLSQQMALMPRDQWGRSDAEKDPTVFAAGLVGHAHNEWLEILAELGAVGFSLMATALGLAFWAGWRAFMRSTDPFEKWFVLGLMAILVAIVVEECADVALRMPVLPIIFYTIIGLLWACSSEPVKAPAESRSSTKAWVGTLGLVASLVGALVISSLVRQDWKGALADGRVPQLIEDQKWDAALAQAQVAGQNRLVLESLISAGLSGTEAAHAAAGSRFEQFRAMLARQSAQSNRARIRTIAEEDIAKFDLYARQCLQWGGGLNPETYRGLWQNVPGIHSVASYMADVLLMKNQLESLKPSLGLNPEQAPFLQNARQWIELDYLRDRFNTAAALRLLSMSGHMPMEYRIDLLRIPLRRGPEPVGIAETIEAAVGQTLGKEQEAFDRAMNGFLQRAAQAAGQSDPDRWPDPYAPETLRLKAMAERVSGRYDQAAMYAERAAALYSSESLRFHYPTALSCGLGDWARSQFLAEPDQPRKAAEICERAIRAWPDTGRDEEQTQTFRRELSLYLLAAGDENAASALIRNQVAVGSDDRLKRNIGYGFSELCGLFIDREPQARPLAFGDWLSRAVSMAPDYPKTRWLAARVALEQGRTEEAIAHLRVALSKIEDEQQGLQLLQSVGELYPENAELKNFIQSQLSAPRNGDAKATSSAPVERRSGPGKPETNPN